MEENNKTPAKQKVAETRRSNAQKRKEKETRKKEIESAIQRELLNVLNDPAAGVRDKVEAARILQSMK